MNFKYKTLLFSGVIALSTIGFVSIDGSSSEVRQYLTKALDRLDSDMLTIQASSLQISTLNGDTTINQIKYRLLDNQSYFQILDAKFSAYDHEKFFNAESGYSVYNEVEHVVSLNSAYIEKYIIPQLYRYIPFLDRDVFYRKFRKGKITREYKNKIVISRKDIDVELDLNSWRIIRMTEYVTNKRIKIFKETRFEYENIEFDIQSIENIKNDYTYYNTMEAYQNRIKPLTDRIGEVVPELHYTTLEGQELELEDMKGKVVLLDYWYTTCVPCIKSMPKIKELYTDNTDEDLVILAINPHDNIEKIKKFAEKYELPDGMLVKADIKDWNKFGVNTAPSYIIIDKEGKVSKVITGAISTLEQDIKEGIEILK